MENGPKRAFVLMPFRNPYDEYYEKIYKPALLEEGFEVHRADDMNAPRPIINDIRKYIAEADLIVCEMSERNPNVFYELGLAHAIGKPVILLTRAVGDIPFDLRHIRVIVYSTETPDWNKALERKIKLFAKEALASDAPIYPEPLLKLEKQNGIEKEKVRLLRWERLSSSEKKVFYESFLELNPRHHKPRAAVVPLDRQYELEKINPIDLNVFVKLLDAFSLPYANIKLPLNEQEYSSIHDIDIKYADRISDQIEYGISNEQKDAIFACYDYLSAPDLAASERVRRDCDVVIVPGARKGMIYRVDEAYKILVQSNATAILSGFHPAYDLDQELQIGEAEAMDYYLRVIKGLGDSGAEVILESRARNTRETAVHILPDLQQMFFAKKRPLNIILVTSPYHMRRFYFLVNKGLQEYMHIVGSITGATSTASFDRRTLIDAAKQSRDRRRYGMGVYIQEFFKIIGGRVTGEF